MCPDQSLCDAFSEIAVDNVQVWTKIELLDVFCSKIKSKFVIIISPILMLKVVIKTMLEHK